MLLGIAWLRVLFSVLTCVDHGLNPMPLMVENFTVLAPPSKAWSITRVANPALDPGLTLTMTGLATTVDDALTIGATPAMAISEPLLIIRPSGVSSNAIGGSVYAFGSAVSRYLGVSPISLTKEVATMKKIRRMKTMSIRGETLISTWSALKLASRLFIEVFAWQWKRVLRLSLLL